METIAPMPAGLSSAVAQRLQLSRVSRFFGDVRAVDDVSLSLAGGEFVCLLGPSGCGKSTLLRLIAGLEQLDGGQIFIDGLEVAGPARFIPPERRGVGLMFQDYALFPHLTVLENVAFGLSNLPHRMRRQAAMAALSPVGMERFAKTYPHTLSGGEQQRVALARALAPKPRIMLMDEPFSGLDQRLRDEVREQTVEILTASGTAVLMVTHDPGEAMLLADRIAMMRGGRLVQVGQPDQLYFHPADADVAEFFSDTNRIHGIVHAGFVRTPFGPVAAARLAEGAGAEVLIRPEQIQLCPPDEAPTVSAMVLRSVPQGTDRLLHLQLSGDGQRLHAKAPLLTSPPAGARTGVRIDLASALVFPCRCGHESKLQAHVE